MNRKVRLEGNKIAAEQDGAISPLEPGELYVCSASEAAENDITREQYITTEELAELTRPTLAQAREAKIQEARTQANALLSQTDYKVLRQTEQETMSAEDFANLKTQRQSIREACNSAEAVVNALQTVDEVLEFRLTE